MHLKNQRDLKLPFPFPFYALEKEIATHSSVLAWRILWAGNLVGCRLRGCTELDTTEATQQQQQPSRENSFCQNDWLGFLSKCARKNDSETMSFLNLCFILTPDEGNGCVGLACNIHCFPDSSIADFLMTATFSSVQFSH